MLAVPMMRDEPLIGIIVSGSRRPGPSPISRSSWLQTFAEQAVIAIENVRLFTELGARNRDLTEALEQQTATSDILRVISRSQTDVQPVFDTIAASVLKLCGAQFANVFTYDGALIHLAAYVNVERRLRRRDEQILSTAPWPRPPPWRAPSRPRRVCLIQDVLADADYTMADASAARRSAASSPFRCCARARPIGGIAVGRPEAGDVSRLPGRAPANLR